MSSNRLKSVLIHNTDPFLKLGPFKLEMLRYHPFRSIFHDFLTLQEVHWMINYVQPRLSSKRHVLESNKELSASEKINSNIRITVSKAIQTWFPDIRFKETQQYYRLNKDERDMIDDQKDTVGKTKVQNRIYLTIPLVDPYSYHIVNDVVLKISKRLEAATTMNITGRHGSSEYQVTNYGLAGMVQRHQDSYGVETGTHLPWDRRYMVSTGDVIATFMGWMHNTKEGGATYFTSSGHENRMFPQKQSAAFWIDTFASGEPDVDQEHGACPVLLGSKWILNKWIHHYNQWRDHPCGLNVKDRVNLFSNYF